MQKMPFRCEANSSPSTSAAVDIVTHHWVSDRREMNADLMGSSRVQMRTQQVSRSKTSEAEEVRSRLSAVIDDCHALSVSRISCEGFFDRESVAVEVSPDHHRVTPCHPSRSDCGAQNPVSALGPRDDQKP